jgi:hypothetical protein
VEMKLVGTEIDNGPRHLVLMQVVSISIRISTDRCIGQQVGAKVVEDSMEMRLPQDLIGRHHDMVHDSRHVVRDVADGPIDRIRQVIILIPPVAPHVCMAHEAKCGHVEENVALLTEILTVLEEEIGVLVPQKHGTAVAMSSSLAPSLLAWQPKVSGDTRRTARPGRYADPSSGPGFGAAVLLQELNTGAAGTATAAVGAAAVAVLTPHLRPRFRR